MKTSIVVPTVTHKLLPTCIKAIDNTCTDYELIVVNDGSRERDLLEFLASLPHQVVHVPENKGFAGACNEGWKVATGDYLVTLNADTEVQPGWLTELLRVAQELKADMVGPAVLGLDKKVQHCSCYWNVLHQRLWPMHEGKTQQDLASMAPHYVDGIGGACMLMSRASLQSVGFFDDRYQNSCEDTDLCLKYLQSGYKIAVAPQAHILHHGAAFRYTIFRERTNIDFSRQLLFQKWGRIEIKHHRHLVALH